MSTELTVDEIELVIDSEFESRLRPHTEAEAKLFRKRVEHDGSFPAAIKYAVLGGEKYILDGHHTWKMWCELPEDTIVSPPLVEEVNVPDRKAALEWIDRNQAGRRNLDSREFNLVLGRIYNEEKGSRGGKRKGSGPKSSSNRTSDGLNSEPTKQGKSDEGPQQTAAQRVAAEYGSTPRRVEKAGAYYDAIESIRAINSKAASDIEGGTMKVSQADVIAMSKAGEESIKAGLKNLRWGKKWNEGQSPPKQYNDSFDTQEIESGKRTFNFTPHIKSLEKLMRFADDVKQVHGRVKEYVAVEKSYRELHKAMKALEGRVSA